MPSAPRWAPAAWTRWWVLAAGRAGLLGCGRDRAGPGRLPVLPHAICACSCVAVHPAGLPSLQCHARRGLATAANRPAQRQPCHAAAPSSQVAQADGEVIITNDGATILNKMRVEQPAAKMLVDLAKSQVCRLWCFLLHMLVVKMSEHMTAS